MVDLTSEVSEIISRSASRHHQFQIVPTKQLVWQSSMPLWICIVEILNIYDCVFLWHRLQLDPHPEGGFYRQTYRSDLPLCSDLDAHQQFKVKPRPCSTAIYFLLPQGRVSHLHRIPSDEMWHFYSGEQQTPSCTAVIGMILLQS